MHPEREHTVDTLNGFHLKLIQPAAGFRFSIDALLLADFVSRIPARTAVEIGAGCGVSSLVAARRSRWLRDMTLLEIQASLAMLARENVAMNPMPHVRFHVRNEDARLAMLREPVDLVFSNPPFHDPKAGRVSPNRERAVARHWFTLRPEELVTAGAGLLKPDGWLAMVIPYGTSRYWLAEAEAVGFHIVRCIEVKSRMESPPALMLVAVSREGKLEEDDQLVLFDEKGRYTQTAAEILGIV